MSLLFPLALVALASPPTLVVAPFQARPADREDAQTITRLVGIYAGQSAAFSLVTPEELGAIDEEIARQLSGGCSEASCIAELGGALGAKYMITGSLDRLGKLYILTLKLIDIEQVRAIGTAASQERSVEAFADSLPGTIRKLFKEEPVSLVAAPKELKAKPAGKSKKASSLGDSSRPAQSCREIKGVQGKAAKSGVYWLDPKVGSGAPFKTYCSMNNLGGGWTLVMVMDGRKDTFAYDSKRWKDKATLAAGFNKKGRFEHKNAGFHRLPFSEVMVGLLVGKDFRVLGIPQKAKSLHALFANGKYRATKLGRKKWKALMKKSSLQKHCNREGFNVHNGLMRVRIGIIANQEKDCKTPDSRLGLGAGSNDKARGPNRAAGNEAVGWEADSGKRQTAAWGYVYVR
jgi:TolB-like protein